MADLHLSASYVATAAVSSSVDSRINRCGGSALAYEAGQRPVVQHLTMPREAKMAIDQLIVWAELTASYRSAGAHGSFSKGDFPRATETSGQIVGLDRGLVVRTGLIRYEFNVEPIESCRCRNRIRSFLSNIACVITRNP